MAEKSAQEKLLYQDVLKYLTERSYRAEAEKQWKRTIRRKVKYFTVNDGQLYLKGNMARKPLDFRYGRSNKSDGGLPQ